MKDIFTRPQYYRNLMLKKLNTNLVQDEFKGKGIACVFLTRFCPVSCDFCFFKSLPQNTKKTEKDAFNSIGMNNLIDFINKANLAYLLVSGGGDPFTEFDNVLRLIKEAKVNKIVLVTSGFWAINKQKADIYLNKIYKNIKNKEVILRLSYDKYHVKKLSSDTIYNILDLFENHFYNNKNFKFRVHTMIEDPSINDFLEQISKRIKDKKIVNLNTDSKIVSKINPFDYKIELTNGFSFEIGFANAFYPDGKIDMRNLNIIKRNLEVFEKDLRNSQNYNSSVTLNNDGSKGLDFWINYNGNVCTWGNQVPDNIQNIYFDNYDEIINNNFSDPIMASYLKKGSLYRYNILNEIAPLTVLKSKLINIRDYVGAILFEEDKIRLYYSIRVLQDFYNEGVLKNKDMLLLPEKLQDLIKDGTKESLITLYNASNYTIIDQFLSKKHSKKEAIKLLELIKLNHYVVDNDQINDFIEKVNKMYDLSIMDLQKVCTTDTDPYDERLIPTKVTFAEISEN